MRQTASHHYTWQPSAQSVADHQSPAECKRTNASKMERRPPALPLEQPNPYHFSSSHLRRRQWCQSTRAEQPSIRAPRRQVPK